MCARLPAHNHASPRTRRALKETLSLHAGKVATASVAGSWSIHTPYLNACHQASKGGDDVQGGGDVHREKGSNRVSGVGGLISGGFLCPTPPSVFVVGAGGWRVRQVCPVHVDGAGAAEGCSFSACCASWQLPLKTVSL